MLIYMCSLLWPLLVTILTLMLYAPQLEAGTALRQLSRRMTMNTMGHANEPTDQERQRSPEYHVPVADANRTWYHPYHDHKLTQPGAAD